MRERSLKVLVFIPVFLGHAFASFVTWALAPGNTTTDAAWPGLRHMANLLFEFPLFNLLPDRILNTWFEVVLLTNSALCAAVLVWLGFRIFRRRSSGSQP